MTVDVQTDTSTALGLSVVAPCFASMYRPVSIMSMVMRVAECKAHLRQPSQAFEARGEALLCSPRSLRAGRRSSSASASSISPSPSPSPLLVEFPSRCALDSPVGQPGTGTSKVLTLCSKNHLLLELDGSFLMGGFALAAMFAPTFFRRVRRKRRV